jgi:serine/threonine protein kinase
MNATTPHDSLDDILGEYLQQVEQGKVPDRAALLAQYPHQAERLRVFFADQDRLDGQAPGLRLTARTGDYQPGDHVETIRYFGDYELLERLAEGGMGVVNKARQVSLNRLVALKRILKGRMASLVDIARFRLEAEAVANLDHPNIVPIYEVGEHEGQQYFAMKYLDGGTLAQRPRGTPREEAALLLKITRAVEFAHRRGVLHRDLKPGNILFDSAGEPCVADFGLAKRLDRDDPALTVSGDALGTPLYMPPEQAAGRRDITVTADIYSLGIILYERLTGQPPFQGKDRLSLLRQVRENDPPPPSSVVPNLPRDLETLCLRCLEKEPARRYSTAGELADELDRYLRGEPILARPISRAERAWRWMKRNPWPTAACAAMLLGAVLSLSFAWWATKERDHAQASKQRVDEYAVNLEKVMARSFLRPFSVGPWDRSGEITVEDHHRLPLWEIAENRGVIIWMRFIDEALSEERFTNQLLHNSQVLLHAAIGLDLQKHELLESYLLDRMINTQQPAIQVKLACLLVTIGGLKQPTARQVCDVVIRDVCNHDHQLSAVEYLEVMKLLIHQISATEAKQYMLPVWHAYLKSKSKLGHLDVLKVLLSRVDREAATEWISAISKQIQQESEVYQLISLLDMMVVLANLDNTDRTDSLLQNALVNLLENAHLQGMADNSRYLANNVLQYSYRLSNDRREKLLQGVALQLQKETDPLKAAVHVTSIGKLSSHLVHANELGKHYRTLAAERVSELLVKHKEPTVVLTLAESVIPMVEALEFEAVPNAKGAIIQYVFQAANQQTEYSNVHRVMQLLKIIALHWSHSAWTDISEQLIYLANQPWDSSQLCHDLFRDIIHRVPRQKAERQHLVLLSLMMQGKMPVVNFANVLGIANAMEKQFPMVFSIEQKLWLLSGTCTAIKNCSSCSLLNELNYVMQYGVSIWQGNIVIEVRSLMVERLLCLVDMTDRQEVHRSMFCANAVLARIKQRPTQSWRRKQAEILIQAIEAESKDSDLLRLLAKDLQETIEFLDDDERQPIIQRALDHLSKLNLPTLDAYHVALRMDALRLMAVNLHWDRLHRYYALALDSITDERIAFAKLYPGHLDFDELITSQPEGRVSALQPVITSQIALTMTAPMSSPSTLGGQLLVEAHSPPLFSDEFLVKLLHRPIGVGPWRRLILDTLGTRHRRYFRDQWDYVRFAQTQVLNIDFTAGPERKLPWKESYRAP